MRLFERCDAIRQPSRFALALLACECDARGRLGLEDQPYPQRERLQAALEQALAVSTAEVAAQAQAQGRTGKAIGEAVALARTQAIQRWLSTGLG
ncbi:Multifunctional CCA protein [compost metagenome]